MPAPRPATSQTRTLALLAALAASVVVAWNGFAPAEAGQPGPTAEVVALAKAAPAAEPAQAAAAAAPAPAPRREATCSRPIRVVGFGYGEPVRCAQPQGDAR